MAKKTPRPGRTLLIFGLTIVVLYGLAALGQTWKPRLGLDLEGGTRITLSAEGNGVTATKLNEARDIVEKRVNGSGVVEPEITTQGDRNIIVEIPGKNASGLVDAAKRTAQLRFRIVAGSPQPGTPAPSPSSSASPSGKASSSGKATPGKATKTPKVETGLTQAAHGSLRGEEAVGRHRRPSPRPPPRPPPRHLRPLPRARQSTTRWRGRRTRAPSGCRSTPPTPARRRARPRRPINDQADEPLITCNDEGLKFLLSKAVIEGTELKSASYGIPQNGTTYAVNLAFKGIGHATSSARPRPPCTTTTAPSRSCSTARSSPTPASTSRSSTATPRSPVTSPSPRPARSSNSLKYGALPLKFTTSVETIGPSLAGNQLSAGIYAGIIGLAIVMIYCLIYYRGLGLVVIASLLIAGVVTYGVVLVLAKSAGFTLTLPGIAGLIVAVGITADSFIVYFERIRDEMREGRSMRVAVETGWARARNTCLAADAVSLLAAVVLYIFAIGVVRGFAFALGVSTIIDVAVFFWFTKPMMTLLARRPFFNTGQPLLRALCGDARHRRRTARPRGGRA